MPLDNTGPAFIGINHWPVLKNFSEDSGGDLLYKGQPIGSGGGDGHTHANKDILDKIITDGFGNYFIDGKKIMLGIQAAGLDTISDCVYWDADVGVTKDANNVVSSWRSVNNNSYVLQSVVQSSNPFWESNRKNGHSAIFFDNLDDGLRAQNPILSGNFTVFVVYNCFSSAATYRRAIQGANTNWLIGPWQGSHQYYAGNFFSVGTIVAGTWLLVVVRQKNSVADIWCNGSLMGSNVAGGGGSLSGIGLGAGGAHFEPLNGYIRNFGFVPRLTTDTEIQTINDYLKQVNAIT